MTGAQLEQASDERSILATRTPGQGDQPGQSLPAIELDHAEVPGKRHKQSDRQGQKSVDQLPGFAASRATRAGCVSEERVGRVIRTSGRPDGGSRSG